MTEKLLQDQIENYSEWRTQLSATIQSLSLFLKENNVTDLRTHHQFESVLGSLDDDNLSIAFVAEFSRGKSEMINSIFFSNYQKRILPTGIGRTTMCPTELLYDPNRPSSIRLLPIESRADNTPIYQLKNIQDRWTEIEFDPDNTKSLSAAVKGMTASKLVSKAYAKSLGFDLLENENSELGLPINEYDEVQIPVWRHAIINLPHPLLKQGLVILDTPGLNAIGAEPELTINQLATAHTIVFILSHDTGVTATDRKLWQDHLVNRGVKNPALAERRLVALNKIDSLWDGIRTEREIDSEIASQVKETAQLLGVDTENIFPVSAQKGLLGRLTNNTKLIERSRINDLESAIADRLLPEKRKIVVEKVENSLGEIIDTANSILDNRLKDTDSHIAELKQISSKNTDVISHIMLKVKSEKNSLEDDMQRYQALRSVYNKETTKLVLILSEERLEKLIVITKRNMARCASSITLQKIISKYFTKLNQYLVQAIEQANEIAILSERITRDFEDEHGITNFRVRRLRLEKFQQEVSRLEQKYSHLKETKTLFFREQMSITNRFYDSVCSASRKIFSHALRDARAWNNNLMVPMETYVREHHTQLRRRLESVKRIHKASDTVETRLVELKIIQTELQAQHAQFSEFKDELQRLLEAKGSGSAHQDRPTDQGSAKILYWDHNISF